MLNVEQLSYLKGSHEQEIGEISSNWQTLKTAQSKLLNSRSCLNIVGAKDSREIMVPLTESLYVPGTIVDSNKVLMDIGTGYFVEKSVPKAQELVDRKLKMVSTNADHLQSVYHQKAKNLEVNYSVMHRELGWRTVDHAPHDPTPTRLPPSVGFPPSPQTITMILKQRVAMRQQASEDAKAGT